MDQISSTIETQKKQIEDFIAKNNASDAIISELKKQIQALTTAQMQLLEINTKQQSELESQKIECLDKLQNIKKQLDDKTSELDELKKKTNLQEFKKTDSLLNEIKELKKIQQTLETQIEDLKRKKSEELARQEISLKQQINKIQKELDDKSTELDKLKKQTQTNANLQEFKKTDSLLNEIKELKTIQQALEKQIEDLKNKKSEELLQLDINHKKQITKIQKELDDKTSELNRFNKQTQTNTNLQEFKKTDSLLNEIKELKIIQQALEKQIEDLKRQKSEELLQQEITLKKQITKLIQDKEKLEKGKLSNQETNSQYQMKIEELSQLLTNVQIENARLKTSLEEMTTKESECTKQLIQIKKDLEAKIVEFEELKKQKRTHSNLDNFNKASSLLNEIKELKTIQIALEKEVERLKKLNSQEKLELESTLKKQITKLINDKEALERSNLSSQESNTKYERAISELTDKLAQIQIENNTLKSTIQTLISTKEALTRDKDTLTMINEDLKGKIEQLTSSILKSQNQLANQQLQTDSKLRNYKDAIIKSQQKHKLQLETLNKAKKDIEIKLLNTERQLTECNQFKENIQMKLEEMIQTHQNDKSKDTSEIERLKKLLSVLQSENERLNMVIEENLQNYNSRYAELKSKIDELTKQIDELNNDNQTMKDGIELQIDELREEHKQDLESKLSALKSEYQQKQDELTKFINNLDKFITRTNNSSEFQSIKTKLNELNDKYNNDITNLKLLNTKLEFEKLNLSKKISKLEGTINLLKSSKISDKEIKDRLEKELRDEIKRLNDFINKKEIELNQLKSKSQSNEQNLLNSVGTITQKENELRRCKMEIKKLEELLQMKNNELQSLLAQIEEFKLKVTALESQITNLQVQTDIDNQTKQSEIDRLNQEISILQNDNITLKDGIQLQSEKSDKKNKKELDKYEKQLTDCKQKLDKCEQDLNSCQVLLTTCKKDLKECKDTSDQSITKIKSELDISNAKLSQLESDKKNLENELKNLKDILSNSNKSTALEFLKLKESNIQLQEENTKLKNSKPIINAMSTPIEDVQVIYKYINNPSNIITNKSQKRLSNTAFDKFITNNKLIY